MLNLHAENGGSNAPTLASLSKFSHNDREVQLEVNYSINSSPIQEHGQSNLQAALKYAQSGIPVFPCNLSNKKPMTDNGFKDATTDTEAIEDWGDNWSKSLIGIPTGKISGLFVIDIDVKKSVNGFETLAALEEQYGKLPATRTVRTPSGGMHLYFVMPGTDQPLSNSTGKLGPGIDTRGQGGYIIAPPSVNSSGKSYQYVDESVGLAKPPEWVIDLLIKPKKEPWHAISVASILGDDTLYGKAALEAIIAEMSATPEGERNDTLFRLSCRLGSLVAGGELSENLAKQIKDAAEIAGLDADEVEKTFASGFNVGMQSPATAPNGDNSGSVAKVADVASVETNNTEWSEPQSLTSKIEARDYPVDALPDTIRAAINEVQAFVKAPVAMVASSALGALSLAIQAHVDVERTSGLKNPVGLFLLTIADSGERKSTCDSYFMKVIRDYEASQRKVEKSLIRDYKSKYQEWEAKEAEILDNIVVYKQKGMDTGDLESNLVELRQVEPESPRIPKLLYSDATTEALAYKLATIWPSGGLISAEAGTVFGSHSMSKESVMKNLAQLNQLWDGTPLSIDRKTSESFVVSGARLTMALQVQETTLRSFFNSTGNLARGTGFLARFLIAWPESTQGTRFFEEAPTGWPALQVFNKKLTDILEKQPKIDGKDGLVPQVVTLDAEAKELWVAAFNRIERKLGIGGDYFEIRDVASKAADNAARLAAIFHVFEHGVSPVCKDCMLRATKIIFWNLNESRRFLNEIALSDEMKRMGRLDEWLVSHCKLNQTQIVSPRDVQRLSPVRKKSELDVILKYLQELDRLRIVTCNSQKMIELNPMLLT
jgi:putative DNA primase/helicase